MTVGFDYYDQVAAAAMIPPTPPRPTAQTAPQAQAVGQPTRARLSAKDLLTWIGLFSLVPLLVGEIRYTEIVFEGATDIVSLLWLLVVAVGNIAAGIFILFAMWRRGQQVTA